MPVTKEQYDAAKAKQRAQARYQDAPPPAREALTDADVEAIREWEAEEDRKSRGQGRVIRDV